MTNKEIKGSTTLQQGALMFLETFGGSLRRLQDKGILTPDEATKYQKALKRLAQNNGIEGSSWLCTLVKEVGSRWQKKP